MFTRKTYSRIPKREVRNGLIDVSREELEDFRNRFGKDRTLRDLLNYDRTGKLPEAPKSAEDTRSKGRRAEAPKPEKDPRARGDQGANIKPDGGAGRGLSAGRTAADRDTAPLRADTGPAPLPRSVVRVKDNDTIKRERDAAIKDKFESTPRSRDEAADRRAMEEVDAQRAERAERRRQEDLKRPGRDAITPILGPELAVAPAVVTASSLPWLARAVASGAPRAVQALRNMVERPSSEGWVRPDLRKEFEAFRRGDQAAMEQARSVREAAEAAARARARPTTGSGRPADTRIEPTRGGELKLDEVINDPPMGNFPNIPSRLDRVPFKKGGKVTSGSGDGIAKGGTVRGGGCETKGKTKGRFV